jgi:hypothetical protein
MDECERCWELSHRIAELERELVDAHERINARGVAVDHALGRRIEALCILRATAERERDAAMNEVGELGIVNEGLALKLAAALRENAELREDRERLDWMEREQRAVMPWSDGWCASTEHPGIMHETTSSTLRAAIDRAREKASE